MKQIKRILPLFKIPDKSLLRLIVALLIPGFLIGCLIATVSFLIIYTKSSLEESREYAEWIYLMIAFILLPLMAITVGSVGLREPRYPPKALLSLLSTVLILIAGTMLAISMMEDFSSDIVVVAFFFLAIICPITLIFSLPAVHAVLRTIPEIRAILIDEKEDRLLEYIIARQTVSFSDISTTLKIPLSEVDDTVDRLLASGKLSGSMDVDQQHIYTAAYLSEKQRQLLELTEVRGRVTMKDLGKYLDVSVNQVYEWIYQLVQRNQFSGYVHWENQMVYAGFARNMGDKTKCPQCGGTLSPSPGGRIVCLHCGTESWSQQAEI